MTAAKENARPLGSNSGALQKTEQADYIAGLPVGNHRMSCPSCGRSERDKTMGLTVNPDGSSIAHCFRCGLIERTGKPATYLPRPAVMPKHTSLSDWGRQLWAECGPISGTAASYLQARRCAIPPADGDLRWHPALKHPSGHVGPALVGLITHAGSCEPLSLHRTWITPTGKARVQPAKLMLKGHQTRDGVIRLWPDEAVTYGLGIAEGIETTLTLAHVFQPAWCVLDAGHLAKFSPLPGIESLTIAADADQVGIQAARACAAAWVAAGKEVFIRAAEAGDLNDTARAAA